MNHVNIGAEHKRTTIPNLRSASDVVALERTGRYAAKGIGRCASNAQSQRIRSSLVKSGTPLPTCKKRRFPFCLLHEFWRVTPNSRSAGEHSRIAERLPRAKALGICGTPPLTDSTRNPEFSRADGNKELGSYLKMEAHERRQPFRVDERMQDCRPFFSCAKSGARPGPQVYSASPNDFRLLSTAPSTCLDRFAYQSCAAPGSSIQARQGVTRCDGPNASHGDVLRCLGNEHDHHFASAGPGSLNVQRDEPIIAYWFVFQKIDVTFGAVKSLHRECVRRLTAPTRKRPKVLARQTAITLPRA